MVKIAPSILSADFANLEQEVRRAAGADYIHVDVMDGLFVPNITVGIPVVRSLRAVTDLPLDVHLMIDRPIRYVERFCEAGADIVTVHAEADGEENIRRCLELIRAQGKRAGLALRPKTPARMALSLLDKCDLVLVMTVEPGFGGQKFMPETMPKLRQLRVWLDQWQLATELEVDGGIDLASSKTAVENGATVLVAGSAVYGAQDVPGRIRELRG
ncbi:MAG: ribulose-phosphate 3-epimerase [Oscillospiraceae bacterium]|nr:ribulose-phosphate 3-epimerase [Oscillospiraceae bacterium]